MLKVEIHLKRQIGGQWAKWFAGLTISHYLLIGETICLTGFRPKEHAQ